MRVYVDASIIIASLLSPTGGSSFLFEYIKRKKIVGITSQTTIQEILTEEKYKKLKRSKGEIEQFITQSGLIIREAVTTDQIETYKGEVDIEDAHLIAGAILSKCSHLATLDKKHLLRKDIQQKFLPLKILSPKELIEKIVS